MNGKKREFTQEEVLYIVNNWGKESAHSMKKSLIALGKQCVELQKKMV